MSQRPIIAITVDNQNNTAASGTYECSRAYSRAVEAAGGMPVLLPHEVDLARKYVTLCDGLVLTGGGDPLMEAFGQVTHEQARRVDDNRQAFELALLNAAQAADLPLLGVCLGMQLMGLLAGGELDQCLAESLGDAAALHRDDREHALAFEAQDSLVPAEQGMVVSWHRQALRSAGSMRVVARAPDGVVEAIDDPARRFYLGVQWHPERMAADRYTPLNRDLYRKLVTAAQSSR